MAKLRAPTADGEVLAVPDFGEVPRLVEENRRKLDRDDVIIGGLSLRELRALARREVLELAADASPPTRRPEVADLPLKGGGQNRRPSAFLTSPLEGEVGSSPTSRVGGEAPPISPDAPLLLTGHQPELAHPGVWVKNFALNGLARKIGGIPLHLVADTDTLKSASLRFPVFRDRDPKSVHLESVAFDTFTGPVPYEDRSVSDAEQFQSVWERTRWLWYEWGYEPLIRWAWLDTLLQKGTIGQRFSATRRIFEEECGCHNLELSVSRLSQTEAFRRFASHTLEDLPRFRAVYNAAIRAYREANDLHSRNHPAPELAEGEAPFWVRTPSGRRERATATSDVRNLRPRALTLTLFARVCLGDFFIHGIGGGKYDEVTDAIIRDYFGIDPPAYQVLSATLHLPLPGFPPTPDDVKRAERHARDLHWNPQRYLKAGVAPELVERKAALAASEPPRDDHAARRAWFRELQRINEQLRPFVAEQFPVAEAQLARVRAEVAANAVLQRRDFAWVLYPEDLLRDFLSRFLTV